MELEIQTLEQFKGQARLPKFAVPKSYDLTLKLDLSACNFYGKVLIDVSIKGFTKFIVLNALELEFHQVSFTNSQNLKYVPSDVLVDSDDEILVLVFEEGLDVGNGVLEIEYSGVLNEHLKGLYRCTYLDKGVKKNMVSTQFEAVDARRCFSCWDEPALKITLENIPSELTALSNMPISKEIIHESHKTVHFEDSIVMSTYLVAIVVGLYDYIEDATDDGIKVRVYCPVGKSEKGKFALNIALKTLEFFTMYFSMPYPLPKLDMVAIPEFSGGAMENYGLITFRENELLQDELHSAALTFKGLLFSIWQLTIVVAHEVAHHWFGNLVTMEWWTHLWLNEGFATWVSYLVTNILFSEWKIWNLFLQETIGGLRMDSLEQSHPIEKSLASYMKMYAFKNAKTEDLWSVLTETSGVEVSSIMDIWTKQKGYPVISVKLNNSTLKFEQIQFFSSALNSDAQWIVPLTLSLGSYSDQKKFLLESKIGQLNIGDIFGGNEKIVAENWWIKINTNQAGFYRVKYDDNLAARLRKAIASNLLSASDEFGILDDAFALCEACLMPFSSLLYMMDTYRKELEYIVLSRLIDVCYSASKILREAIPKLASDLNQFFISLLLSSAEKLGWEATPGESQLNALMREEVLMALANFGHPQTNEEAIKHFQAFINDENTSLLPVDTRKAAYVAVMRNTSTADRSGLQLLKKLYREVDAVQEKTRILRCMASCPDPSIVAEVLDFMLSDEVRHQDAIYVLQGISWEARATAWTWFKEKWDLILKKWGAEMLLTHFVRDIITPLCCHEMANEVEAFFGSHPVPSIELNLKQSVELYS
ncbi:hypothetical protein RD792_015066 [Penstemon davidsonii]|uniref:Aminopeptidase n=1 Tax=Penstemon davidsonii TaxID=160366 RepID=A0ABR0CS07_9LAMI|nr:hypothetical protein RD792_015066 [Penstemon davidsonii]